VFVELLSRAPRPIGHLTLSHLCPNAVLFGDVPKLVTCGSHALQFCTPKEDTRRIQQQETRNMETASRNFKGKCCRKMKPSEM
jgi:hypothetical protein